MAPRPPAPPRGITSTISLALSLMFKVGEREKSEREREVVREERVRREAEVCDVLFRRFFLPSRGFVGCDSSKNTY